LVTIRPLFGPPVVFDVAVKRAMHRAAVGNFHQPLPLIGVKRA
jgi:hypothetical protein